MMVSQWQNNREERALVLEIFSHQDMLPTLVAYKAHVWLTHHAGERRVDLGTIEVTSKPEHDVQVSFEYEGKPRRGLIDQIDPYDWEKRPGIIPRIHVRLSGGE